MFSNIRDHRTVGLGLNASSHQDGSNAFPHRIVIYRADLATSTTQRALVEHDRGDMFVRQDRQPARADVFHSQYGEHRADFPAETTLDAGRILGGIYQHNFPRLISRVGS